LYEYKIIVRIFQAKKVAIMRILAEAEPSEHFF